MIEVTVRHNFETGHRLPHLPGKCQNLHGHSWWASVTVMAPELDRYGMVVDFGWLKRGLREWIDTHLDHGLMLGTGDPLSLVLPDYGKVFVFEESDGSWPTVENVATLLGRVGRDLLDGTDTPAWVERVVVRETHVNEAAWTH